ncbi:head-tail adaptor protein [Jhaorihella thermophila]|uniref:Head-tail adaptor n=1 Tax=Jhaorihella thermophila TaxID=488547 RepID=A0A1H5X3W0_9RHOB|nr:head-tail adaptor protein [Jhaorihella thermophila]SEG06105.1 head-tail adaptor [Jhaorihella thermophila]
MRAPRLNRALVLERPVRAPDGAGGFSEAWEALGTVWAEVTARTGRERGEAGMPVSTVVYRIVLRAAPVGASMRPEAGQRFRDGARIFAIRAVAERDPDGRFLICFCDEEVAA